MIASLNGSSSGRWLQYAKEMESAGADALELNLQQAVFDSVETSNDIEARLCNLIRQVGAAGLVLFTHMPQWDVSTDRMHWTINWELSPINSIGCILEGIVRARAGDQAMSIAASGSVSNSEDAIKAMIAGADVVMVTSAVYRRGPDAIRDIVDGIERHVESSPFRTLQDFREACPRDHAGDEKSVRLEYIDPLTRKQAYFGPTPVVSQQTGDSFGHQT